MSHASVEKQRLIELLQAGTRELTHLDFKRELFRKGKSVNDDKKAEVAGYTKLYKDIMGMYNTPKRFGSTFPSTGENPFGSSYIFYGVDYKENKLTIEAFPIDKADNLRGFIDERILQDQVQDRFNYPVSVKYYEINLSEADYSVSTYSFVSWIKPGCYGLIEIVHNNTKGPLFVKSVTDRKVGKGTKNEIANKLYVRKQASTGVIDPDKNADCILAKEIFSKFDAKYAKYSLSLDNLKESTKPIHNKSFNILLTNSIPCWFKEEQTELLSSLRKVKWNIVFDTDERTDEKTDETMGMFQYFKEKMVLPTINFLRNDYIRLEDEGWKNSTIPNEVAHGKSCLYVLANGDSTINVKENANFRLIEVQNLSNILFQRFHLPLKLVVYILVLSTNEIKLLEDMCVGISEAWEEVNQSPETSGDAGINSSFVFISFHEGLIDLLKKYLPKSDTFTFIVAPIKQISDFFFHFHHDGKSNKKLEVPGSAGNVAIKVQDMKTMEKYFAVYHINLGLDHWSSLTNVELKEKYTNDVSTKFLQGFHLTPEALFLHEQGVKKIYVERNIVSDSVKKIRNILQLLHHSDNDVIQPRPVEKSIVQLIHEPSAGGTTIGRIVSWKLRKDYPVINLLNLEGNYEEVIDWLNYLYTKCQLPLCILIDTSVTTNTQLSDVIIFAGQVLDKEIQAAIFFVQQVPDINEKQLKDNQLILFNKLTDDEKFQFDDLMKKAGDLLKKTPSKTITLYGLCQFNIEYQLLKERLEMFRIQGPTHEKTLLLLASVVYSYSRVPLPFYFVAKIFDKNIEQCYTEGGEMLDSLHMARDFLVVEEDENIADNFHNGVRPVTTFVSNKILEIVFGNKRDYLVSFIHELICLLEPSKICDHAITAVSKPLFIQRSFILDVTKREKERFSRFVNDMETANGINSTVDQLTKIANSVDDTSTEEGPHIRSMLARYLAKQKGDINEALIEMHRALRISLNKPFSTTKSNDSTLLTTAGNLINLKLHKMAMSFNSCVNLTSIPDEAVLLFNDGKDILQRAQKNESNSYAFIAEARLWFNYMNLYFCGNSSKSPAKFSRLLESCTDKTLATASEEAVKKLGQLECLLQKRDMDGYDENTEEQISDLKMKILALKIDIHKTKEDTYFRMCKTDPWLVRGLVDFYFYHMEGQRQNEQYPQKPNFERLPTQALQNIIEIFAEHQSNDLTQSNYRHAILAIIYISKHPPRMQRGNMLMVQNFAESWSKKFPDDNHPHYYLALIYLVQALSVDPLIPYAKKQKKGYIQKMRDCYKKCKELSYKKDSYQRSTVYKRHPHEIQFVLGEYDTLRALVPKDTNFDPDKVGEYRLRKFYGKARGIESGYILWCEELETEVRIPSYIYNSRCKKRAKERPEYSFYVQARTSGFIVEGLL